MGGIISFWNDVYFYKNCSLGYFCVRFLELVSCFASVNFCTLTLCSFGIFVVDEQFLVFDFLPVGGSISVMVQ